MLLIKNIIDKLGCLEFIGTIDTPIDEIIPLTESNIRENSLFWCSDKNMHLIETVNKGTLICSRLALTIGINPKLNHIIVENPRFYFSQVAKYFFYKSPVRRGVSLTARIHETSTIGVGCYIGEYVVIEENCVVGDYCSIDHHTVLHDGTVLKNNIKIGCSNTIGGLGFGYEKNEAGQYEPITHLGNVMIEDNVEIGNNTCIDRAALASTVIGKNVKIDNLVHIGHGVIIGANSLIIANAMIGGSVTIGENVWIAPSASIIHKITVGDNSLVGLSAVVIKPVGENTVVIGNPAKELKKSEVR